jgi:hydroxyacylglutathione hydrolase
MKKTIKRILWGVIIFAVLLSIAATIFFINFWRATKSMTPSETGAINDSVWCLKDRFVNAYLFKGQKGYVMVDAGMGKKIIKKEMDRLGINPEKVTNLLFTHTDGDHIGATALFKNAKLYMQREEEQMINGTTGKTRFSKTIWKYGPYTLLDNNYTFTADGLEIRIIHTPGHTPGSSCYIIGSDYLLSGDNLVIKDGKYEHFIGKFNMNTLQQEESLKLLPDPSKFKYILTSHHGVVNMHP